MGELIFISLLDLKKKLDKSTVKPKNNDKTTKIVDKLNKFNKMENIICNTAIVYHPPKQ